MLDILLEVLMFIVALFLILLVLVQRGKGGGLTGALGGMGGQSAFGTKAGDVFTRITIIVAAVWIMLCVVAVKVFNSESSMIEAGVKGTGAATAKTTGDAAPAKTATDSSPAPLTPTPPAEKS